MEIQKDGKRRKRRKEGGKERGRENKGKTREQTKRKVKVTHLVRLFFFPSFFCGQSVCQVSDSLQPPRLYSPWNSPGQNPGLGNCSLFRGSSHPGIKPRSPALQADSLPAEPPGKPKNTGVCRLSLLQRIFLAQELNQALLNFRQILYQLSNLGSPKWKEIHCNLEIIRFARSSFWFVHKRPWKNLNELFGQPNSEFLECGRC